MSFNELDRVIVYGVSETIQWFAKSDDKYKVTGRVVRKNCQGNSELYKVELDNSGSQDSEGNPAIILCHEKQMRAE